MGDWISDVLLFSAGIAGGVLIMTLIPALRADRRRHTELFAARSRILADLKDKHQEELLEEAFRTTQAIRGELDHSLQTLRKTVATVLTPVSQQKNGRQ
jgi:ribosomal protein L29